MSQLKRATFTAFKAVITALAVVVALSVFPSAVSAERPRAAVKLGPMPKEKEKEKLSMTVYIDDHFTPQQRYTIVRGIHEWVRATNGLITMDDRYGWNANEDMRDIPKPNRMGVMRCTSTVHIARAEHDYPFVADVEKEQGAIDGVAYHDCNVQFIILVIDRIESEEELYQTSMHEMGHILGLHHTYVPWKSTMYPSDEKPAMCVTDLDLAQLCDISQFSCDPKKLWPCVSTEPSSKKSL